MKKSEILDKLETLSSEDIVNAIRDNIVSIKEIEMEGVIPYNQLREITNLIENAENIDWEKANTTNTVEAYQNYLNVYPNGKYKDEALKKIEEVKLKEIHAEEEAAWQKALSLATIDAFREYLRLYPNAIHKDETNKKIATIDRQQQYAEGAIEQLKADINRINNNKKILVPQEAILNVISDHISLLGNNKTIMELIKNDPNIVDAEVINHLLSQNIITRVDLQDIGIDRAFIKYLDEYHHQKLIYQDSAPPTSITNVLTEVYFWGIPSSGKTCAIGAILSASKNEVAENLAPHPDSRAYGFMNILAGNFTPNSSQVCTLPSGTPVGTIHEMKFTLRDKKKLLHPIAFLDLAGELFTCMFKANNMNRLEALSAEEEKTLNIITTLLKNSQNRKIHFFVIEYGAEDKLYGNLKQGIYLEAATAYIKNEKVFDKSTDGIYILITKTDKIPHTVKDKKTHLQEYIKNHFIAFYKNLKTICEDYEINNGKVEILPFSMGKVCFQNFCHFDSTTAKDVSSLILSRSITDKPKGFWSKFSDLLTQ